MGPHPCLEHAIARLAGRQYNVVALGQLHELGLTADAARKRVSVGRWRRVHRGVYSLGHANLTGHGNWMAAVLACGEDAALSHRSCGALRNLRPDHRSVIDVTSPTRAGRKRDDIVAHQARDLLPRDIEVVDGIRCTSLARTLLDLAEVMNRRGIERALDSAEQLRVLDLRAIDDILSRAQGRRGVKLLRSVLAEHYPGSTITKTKIEELFLQICRDAGLPQPEVNVWLTIPGEEWQVDFLWRQQRLVVETDGRATHNTPQAFERDRRRDQILQGEGWRVIRFTWLQIMREPEDVAARLRRILARRQAA